MTIRDALNQKKRRAMACAFLGLALVPLGIYLTRFSSYSLLLLPVSLLIFAGNIAAASQGLKCPSCREPWPWSAGGGSLFSIDWKIRFCPFCGIGIDSEARDGLPVFGPAGAAERFSPRGDSAICSDSPERKGNFPDERTWTQQ